MHSYDYGRLGDEPTQQLRPVRPPRQPWWRSRTVLAIGASCLAVFVLLAVGFIVLTPTGSSNSAEPDRTVPVGTATATASATPSPTASATPTPTPTTAKPTAARTTRYVPPDPVVPVPTKKEESNVPPADPPAPLCSPTYGDSDASAADVQTALAAAGGHAWWGPPDVSPVPNGWPEGTPYPKITVPTDLMYAVAWTESSWRSSAVGCVGEVGLMQLKSGTADWMNDRFGESSDLSTVPGNAELGAMYLEWLTMYFGLYYFGSFDLTTEAPVGDDGATLQLRDVVIAAYNVGYDNVETENDPETDADDTLHIGPIGQNYLDLVLGNLSSQPWA